MKVESHMQEAIKLEKKQETLRSGQMASCDLPLSQAFTYNVICTDVVYDGCILLMSVSVL